MEHSHHHHSERHNADHRTPTNHAEHDKHAGHSIAMFKDRFWISFVLTIPVLLYSDMIQQWLRFSPPTFPGSGYVPFVLSSVIFLYGGLVFIRSAAGELNLRRPGMMTLISLAITTAYVYSVAAQFFIEGEGFFWELATLVSIMLLGHWLEMAAVARAENALDEIAKLLPDAAEKLVGGKPRKVMVSELVVGDLVLVRPGSRIPVDGLVATGKSSVDEAAFSGESKPVLKAEGDMVVAGTANQDGSLTVRITHLGEDTALAGIMRLVSDAQASKSNVQVLADKAAFVLTIAAILSGIATFAYWLTTAEASVALERAVTVLIIACPHALGLAIPLVVSISTTLSARNGLLVRRRLALESARNLDMVLFDKTGTLTRGEHGVTGIWAGNGYAESEILRLAGSLEQPSEHIVGKGIVKEAENRGLHLDTVHDFEAIPGLGVRGELSGKQYVAAGQRYISDHGITVPPKLASALKRASNNGASEVYVLLEHTVIGAIAMSDMLRVESPDTIRALRRIGIKSAMITGDSKAVAGVVAQQLQLDTFVAEVRPEDKAAEVKRLQEQGLRVAFVGDGVNDAPALTQADIGIAIGAGTDVAIKSADIILVKSNPMDVAKVINLSKAAYAKMAQNLFWATGYNVIAIPLAAGVLHSRGFTLSPALGAALMSVSTVVVALNAQLLRRKKL